MRLVRHHVTQVNFLYIIICVLQRIEKIEKKMKIFDNNFRDIKSELLSIKTMIEQ